MCWLTPNVGDLVQREHPPKLGLNRGSDTVQDKPKVTITD